MATPNAFSEYEQPLYLLFFFTLKGRSSAFILRISIWCPSPGELESVTLGEKHSTFHYAEAPDKELLWRRKSFYLLQPYPSKPAYCAGFGGLEWIYCFSQGISVSPNGFWNASSFTLQPVWLESLHHPRFQGLLLYFLSKSNPNFLVVRDGSRQSWPPGHWWSWLATCELDRNDYGNTDEKKDQLPSAQIIHITEPFFYILQLHKVHFQSTHCRPTQHLLMPLRYGPFHWYESNNVINVTGGRFYMSRE